MIFLRVSFAQVLWFTRFRTLQILGVVLGRGSPVLTIVTHTAHSGARPRACRVGRFATLADFQA